jgi:polynucleotide 5'-kinase involved in rRNA processing
VVIGRNRWINPENIKRAEEVLGKKIMVTFKGDEKGLLLALYNDERKFLGIGVLREIDYRRKVVKIFTPVSSSISTVVFGRVRLDENLKEIAPPIMEESVKHL